MAEVTVGMDAARAEPEMAEHNRGMVPRLPVTVLRQALATEVLQMAAFSHLDSTATMLISATRSPLSKFINRVLLEAGAAEAEIRT